MTQIDILKILDERERLAKDLIDRSRTGTLFRSETPSEQSEQQSAVLSTEAKRRSF